MGFNLKKIANVANPIVSGVNGVINDALHPGSTTQNQVPLETPEQRAARQALLQFGQTGTYGGFTAGADIGVKGPDTAMTGTELAGQSALQDLLKSGIPSQFKMGDQALASILNPDPNAISAQFDPFKAQVMRQINQSNNDLKRTAGFGGNLYSTGTIKGLGDIQARGNETLTAQLASLTNDALNRRAAAIPLAYQSGTAQEGIAQNRISSAYQYGGLPRTLANQGTDAANAEAIRKRNEMLLPLNSLQSVAGQNANFGVPSVTVQNPNPMLDLLTSIIGAGGKAYGAKG